jgi:hypothetical protein
VRPVPGVDVAGSVVDDAREAARGHARPVEDRGDPRRRDVGVGGRGRPAAETGVGDRHRLRRAVVPGGVGVVAAEDHAARVLVVLPREYEVLDPGDVVGTGEGVQLLGPGGHEERPPVGARHAGPGSRDRRLRAGGASSPLELDRVDPRTAPNEPGAQLVGRVEGPHPPHAGQGAYLSRLGGRHPDLEGEVRHVLEQLRPGGGQRVLPRGSHRTGELHQPHAAGALAEAPGAEGHGHGGRALRGHERGRAQPDGRVRPSSRLHSGRRPDRQRRREEDRSQSQEQTKVTRTHKAPRFAGTGLRARVSESTVFGSSAGR